MKPISPKIQNMLDSGYQLAPQARLKVDIDPPFVGVDFMADACDPSLYEFNGVLYLSFIDTAAGKLKVGIVDTAAMRVTSLFRVLSVPSARRPHLCFEPSTYPGKPDLPHIAYDDMATGKAMIYREQYDAQGNVVIVWDDIGTGRNCETVRIGDIVVDFYIRVDGVVYSRKQGKYAEKFIDYSADNSAIDSIRVFALPDCRFAVIMIIVKSDGTCEALIAYSELFGSKIFDESFEVAAIAKSINMPQTVFYFDESFMTEISVSDIKLLSDLINLSESFYSKIDILQIELLSSSIIFNESFYTEFAVTGITLPPPQWLNVSFYVSLSVSDISLI